MDITTVVADLDGNGVIALQAHADVVEVLELLNSGKFIPCEDDLWVSSACVKYVQKGRKSLPVSSSPSSLALAEHGSLVSGVHQ